MAGVEGQGLFLPVAGRGGGSLGSSFQGREGALSPHGTGYPGCQTPMKVYRAQSLTRRPRA